MDFTMDKPTDIRGSVFAPKLLHEKKAIGVFQKNYKKKRTMTPGMLEGLQRNTFSRGMNLAKSGTLRGVALAEDARGRPQLVTVDQPKMKLRNAPTQAKK